MLYRGYQAYRSRKKNTQRKQRINTIHYGEALTSDEVLEQLKEEEMEKKKRRDEKQRGRKKATRKKTRTHAMAIIEDKNHCQICGAEFQEDEEDTCLRCDGCWRRVHCYCAGLDASTDEEIPWFCDHYFAD